MLDNHQLPWTDRPFSDGDSGDPVAEDTGQEPLVRRTFSIMKIAGILSASMVVGTILIVIFLRWIPVPTSAFMLQYDARSAPLQYQWVPWERISSEAAIAVVAAEDQNFQDHWGFDFDAIADAMDANKRRPRPRGASTISQQVAKNLFLWPGKSWLRKGIEAYFTVLIELFWPKKRILEVYLNVAEFGPGIYGVGAAGEAFFNISAAKLSREQASLLAAVLPNPSRLHAARPSDYVYHRAYQIRRQVEMLGGSRYLSAMETE